MNLLFEIADKDLIFLALAFLALIIFGVIIFYVVTKSNKVVPIDDDDRFDSDEDDDDFFEEVELTDEQREAKEELERVYNKMSADLERETKEPVKEEVEINNIDAFEREQEENAIISYQELLKHAEAQKKIAPKREEYRAYDEKPKVHEREQLSFEIDKEIEEPKKFKNSEIISPIFGIQSEGKHVQRQAVKQRKVTPKNNQGENEEFLNSLKEFRKKL